MKFRPNVGVKEVLLALRSCTGLTRVLVEFHGQGDSGDIENACIEGLANDIGDMELPAEVIALFDCFNDGGDAVKVPLTVQQFIDEWAQKLINEHTNWDWYNNDGGGGKLEIEPYTGRVAISGYYNETVQHDADGTDLSLDDDPDFKPLTEEERNELEHAWTRRYG